MILKKLKPMPKDFLWGASTSAYQVEGANLTHGKGPSVQDIKKVPEGTSELDVCADFYHHYKEDIALMAEMGFKTFRFSVAWSRILPEGTGAVNQEGIDFYNNGDRVKFWLTINEQNVLTLNGEVIGTCDLKGVDNKYKKLYQENHHMLLAQAKAMALCHEMVPGGKIGPAPNISLVYPASCKPKDVLAAQNLNAIRNWLYLDMAVFGRYNNLVWAFLEEHDATPVIEDGDMDIMASAHPDFIGFNYYSTATVEWNDGTEPAGRGDQQISGDEPGVFKAYPNPNLLRTEFGWEIDPDGFRATMREIYSRYHLPMIVTENGLGAYDKLTEDGKVHDQYRIEYLRKHIEQIKLACSEGVEMMGYCPWSAIDLVSTHEGVVKRYGFIYVNRDEFDLKDLARYKKDSFYWYKKVIETNGEDLTD